MQVILLIVNQILKNVWNYQRQDALRETEQEGKLLVGKYEGEVEEVAEEKAGEEGESVDLEVTELI